MKPCKVYGLNQIAIIVIALMLTACGGKGEVRQWGPGVAEKNCYFPDSLDIKAPGWLCTEMWEGADIVAVGSFRETNAGIEFQQAMAMAEGRERIASRIDNRVSQLIKRNQSVQSDSMNESISLVESRVTEHLSNVLLPGTQLFVKTVNPETKRMYVLVGIDNEKVKLYQGQMKSAFGSAGIARGLVDSFSLHDELERKSEKIGVVELN